MKALTNQKWFRLLFILALSLILTAGALVITSNVATAQEQELTTAATTTRLNLREGPGLTASVIRVLDAGEEVQLTGFKDNTGEWVQVITSEDETGWVAVQFLTPAPDMNALEVFQEDGDDTAGEDDADTGDDDASDDEPEFSSAVVTATTTVNLNLRESPSLSAAILDVLPAGTVVGFTGFTDSTGQWVQVDAADGPVGWVAAQFLSNVPDGLQELGATDDTEDADDADADDATDDEPAFGSDVVTATTTANVNLREMPGLDAPILQVLPLGSVIGFTGFTDSTGQWVQVDPADGPVGWVAASLLSFVPDGLQDVSQAPPTDTGSDDTDEDMGDTGDDSAFDPDADTATTTVNLNLRQEPSLSGTIITTLPAGTTVAFTGFMTEGGDWVQVETANGQIGWVSAQFLDNVPDNLAVWQGNADDSGEDAGSGEDDGS